MKKAVRILVPLMLILLILASIVWYLFVYDRTFTRDTLLSQARFQDSHGNARISSWFYNMAYSFSDHDESVAIELANQYKADGNFTKAEYTLTNAINTGATAELYIALCRTYVQQDKLLDAVNMLGSIKDPSIKAEVDKLRPSAPSADYAAGYYSQHMDIHLSSNAPVIFYTMDGTYPSTAGTTFSGSISLPTGETTVYAIAVGENGLVSPISVLGYTITGIIEEVTFTDAAMEAAIRKIIDSDPDDKVYSNELWTITDFTVPKDVVNFSDLSLMPYLESLTISEKTLNDFDSLTTLENLKNLDLTGCRFPSDALATLATLPSLTKLTLAECNLSTIAGLADAQNLTHLDLNNNTIRNLEVLSPMTMLREINLDHNAVTSLSDLSSLINLETLKVSYNSVSSLEVLGSCTSLRHIEADHNQINTLRGLQHLSALQHLSVDYNKLNNLEQIRECYGLVNLSVGSNYISDLSPLTALTKMEVLDFSGNQISQLPTWPDSSALTTIDGSFNQLTSLDSLANLQNLAYVYMDYNLLTSVDALENCYRLIQVNVYGNPIPDVRKLRDRDIIVNYDPTAA